MSYAEEKLKLAIYHSFILGEDDSRRRLVDAFQYYLFTLGEANFTEDHWNRFKSVKDRVTLKGPILNSKGDVIVGAFQNGVTGLRKKTASKLIGELVSIYEELQENVL